MDESVRVLHVDDEPGVAEVAASFLEREDDRITVDVASSASEGLERLSEDRFDCVVSDYEMPESNGIEFLQSIRAEYPKLPFILFTGKGSEAVASEAIRAGVTDYLQKETGTEQYELLANRIVNAVTKQWAQTNYLELFDKVPVGLTLHDPDTGRITDSNRAFAELVGYDRGTIIGRHPGDLSPDSSSYDAERASRAIRRTITDGPRALEWQDRTKSGDVIWVRVNLAPATIDGRQSVLAVVQNITDRKRRDRKLEQLRRRTRELTYTQSIEATAEHAVDAAVEIIGAPLSSVQLLDDGGDALVPAAIGESVPDTFDEPPVFERASPRGSRSALVWEVFQEEDPVSIPELSASDRLSADSPAESVLLEPVGDHGVFIVSSPEVDAFSDTDVLLVEILANHLEAALDRVEREAGLRERERRLERLHDATRKLVRADSPEAIADYVVEAAEEILGFSITVFRLYDSDEGGLVPVAESDGITEIIAERETFTPEQGGLNWAAYESGETRVYDDVESLDRALDQGTGLRSLMILPMAEYGTFSVGETTPGAFDATDESMARLLATAAETALQDETQTRRLRRQRDELKRQNDRLDTFASVVSHDLRNPLNVATGHLELARAECESDHLDAVSRSHDRMESLIEDLLSFARAGQAALDTEPVAVADPAEQSWRAVETAGATLTIDSERTVRADPDRLRQLLENFLANAAEHGGETPTVTVGDLDDGFYVADDGPGVPDGLDPFEPGYSDAENGAGFGLAIVAEIAEAHGWTVAVTESADGGARFEITGVDVEADVGSEQDVGSEPDAGHSER